MNKIANIELFNMPVSAGGIELQIDSDKQVLMLTGYNGSGKSRTIGVILETLALLRDVNHDLTSYNWLVEITLQDGVSVRSAKMKSQQVLTSDVRDAIEDQVAQGGSLHDAFVSIKEILHKKPTIGKFKAKNQEHLGFACLAASIPPDQIKEFADRTNVIAYIDSEIKYNFSRQVPDAVSKEPGITQTLQSLFFDLAVKLAENNEVFDRVYALIKEFEALSKKTKKGKRSGAVEEEAGLAYVKSKLDPELMAQSVSSFEQTEVFVELNKFFALTNRQLRWSNKHAYMVIDGEEVLWPDFSKGEKTLLALLLTVHLYGENSIFLFDEPDLSLHMEWQRMLVPAMIKLAPSAQFIISTHSPFMVMNTDHEQIVNMANFHKTES